VKDRTKPPGIRAQLSHFSNEEQKKILINIFNKLYTGEKLLVKDIDGLSDLTRMKFVDYKAITGLQKVQLYDLLRECPSVQNPDSTYSITNLVRYLFLNRKKGDRESGVGNINTDGLTDRERKERADAGIKEVQLQKLLDESMPISDHKQILANRFKGLIDFIKINFECRFKALANKSEGEVKILGKQVMKDMLTAYCNEFTDNDLGKDEE
jgi:hypothetical protein